MALLFAHVLPAMCGEESPETTVPAVPEQIEEIIVYGEKSIIQLRSEFNLAQERLFDVFNSLNTDDNFHVECDRVQRIGSRRWHHVCTPKFATRPWAHASGVYTVSTSGLEDRPNLMSPWVKRKNEAFWDEMARLVKDNPELQNAVTELAAKKNALDAELEQRRND